MEKVDINTDFCAWIVSQVCFLKKNDFESLDLKNLIEELQAMGRREKREVKSKMIVLITYLLKWKFQPKKNAPSWKKTLYEQRMHLRFSFMDSPSLKNDLSDREWIDIVWRNAIKSASVETEIPVKSFPIEPIWTFEQILDDDFFPSTDE